MKNLIYISIIAVVLTACKGNSFMKQRYTNFAHHTHKASAKDKIVVRAEPVNINEKGSEIINEIESTDLLASTEKGIERNDIILANANSIQIYNSTNLVSKKETDSLENTKPVVKEKNVTKQKSQVAKRIIGTLFKIVLWIIILAVVVVILLIVGALA